MNMENPTSIRKESIERLERNGLRMPIELPILDSTKIRDIITIGKRIIILTEFKALTMHPEDRETSLNWLKENNLYDLLTNEEKKAIQQNVLTERQLIDFSWYQESLYALAWVTSLINIIEFPSDEADVLGILKNIPPDVTFFDFFSTLKLRSENELFQELDYYYLLHWLAKRDTEKLNLSVTRERRKALEWVCDNTLEWDNISLDT